MLKYEVDLLVLMTNFMWILPSFTHRVIITVPILLIAITNHVYKRKFKIIITFTDLCGLLSFLILMFIQIYHVFTKNSLQGGRDFIFWMCIICLMILWSRQVVLEGEEYAKKIAKAFFYIIGFSCLMSLPFLVNEYGLIRSYSTSDTVLLERISGLPYSVGSWLQYTTLAILLPAFVTWSIMSQKFIIWIILGVILISCIVSSLSSVLLYVFVGCIGMYICINLKNKKLSLNKVLLDIGIFLAGIIFIIVVLHLLNKISANTVLFDNSANKLVALLKGMAHSGVSADFTGRLTDKLQVTIDAIVGRPFLGWGYGNPKGPAGHMHFLDVIGWFGIPGIFALLGIFTSILYSILKIKNKYGETAKVRYYGLGLSLVLLIIQSIAGGIIFSYMLGMFYVHCILLEGLTENSFVHTSMRKRV